MMPTQLELKLNEFLIDARIEKVFEATNHHCLHNTGTEQKIEPSSRIPMIPAEGITAEGYLQILDENNYSAVFDDGAVVVIQATFRKNDLYSHRYLYIPCPIAQEHISSKESNMPLADRIRVIIDDSGVKSIKSSGYLRFDYVQKCEQLPMESHPISHMTFISESCRVPVYRPLTIASFFNFIFNNYYRKHRSFWQKYSSFLSSRGIEDTITEEERRLHHLDWSP